MQKLDSSEIAALLGEFGRRAMLYGGNPYRAKAYLRAAERVALMPEPIENLIRQNRLKEIPGVGEAIAGVITEIIRTGTHPSLEKMRSILSSRACMANSARIGKRRPIGSYARSLTRIPPSSDI